MSMESTTHPDIYTGSLTKTNYTAECDIHNIIRKATKAGTLPMPKKPAVFIDVSDVGDFKAAQQKIQDASVLLKKALKEKKTSEAAAKAAPKEEKSVPPAAGEGKEGK